MCDDNCPIYDGDYCADLWQQWQDAIWSGNGAEADRLLGDLLANLGDPDDDGDPTTQAIV